jgi:hypothetical protein
MQPRYVCTLKMGYCSLSYGGIEIRFTIASYITVYVTHKSVCWNVFRENLHILSQSVFLQTLLLMWTLQQSDGAYCLTEHVFFKVWVKMLDLFCYYTKVVFQNQVHLPLTYTLCAIFPTHNCPHMTENPGIIAQECSQWQFYFHCRFHLLIRKYSRCIQ